MTTSERHLFLRTSVLGVLLTLAVVVAVRVGWLDSLERWIYDRRARTCQFFTPPPTDRLVHLDIDDSTLEAMGPWPWPRARLARVIDELRLAGAKAVGLDIVLPEPQEPDYEPRPATVTPAEEGGAVEGTFDIIANDQLFAGALRKMEPSLVPLSFDPPLAASPRKTAMFNELMADLELKYEDVDLKLAALHAPPLYNLVDDYNRFLQARQDAMFNRVLDALTRGNASPEELRKLFLPRTDPQISGSPQLRLLRTEYDRVEALLSLRKFARPVPEAMPLFLPGALSLCPTIELARAASATGFVYYAPDPDGVVRNIPLWVEHRGYLFPQLALALACAQLDTSPKSIKIAADRMSIPVRGRADIVLPLRKRHMDAIDKDVGAVFDIPWFGTETWEFMFDPSHKDVRQHVPLIMVWQLNQIRQRVINNNRAADAALIVVLEALAEDGKSRLDEVMHSTKPLDDPASRLALIDWTRTYLEKNGYYDSVASFNPDDLARERVEAERALHSAEDQIKRDGANKAALEKSIAALRDTYVEKRHTEVFYSSMQAIKGLAGEMRGLQANLESQRNSLRGQVEGRSVLIGWTASSVAADFVPTSLHAKCPGPVVHGVIFNAIMTGEVWWRASGWTTFAMTLALGLCVTAAAALLAPGAATLVSFLLGLGYLFLNAIVLFDYGNLIVNASGPLVAVGLVWSGTTFYRFVASVAERRRMKKMFQNYVDPALVDYVLENPEAVQPSVRELTVVFTDLAGFTTLSEKLKEKTVSILNEYLSLMVPTIAEQKEPVIKFLGDGVMFFYGAPRGRDDHAFAAVATVMKMQKLLPEFNQKLAERGLPLLTMRAGISTGEMIVGNAGSSGRSDYTVLGDAVNLGARLESANKASGTRTLLSERTAELVGDLFLLRPVGRLVVVGKTEGVMTYEPLAYRSDATDAQREMVEKTRAMVDAFQQSRFQDCLNAASALENAAGPSPLTTLYRALSEQYLSESPPEGFAGQVVLTEK